MVSAVAGVGTGIAYLYNQDYQTISQTITNTLAITSGIICDGAKAPFTAKIAVPVGVGIMGLEMDRTGNRFNPGNGIIGTEIEDTVKKIGRLGRIGMCETHKAILSIMTGNREAAEKEVR